MGLRERKIERTRASIVETALRLFASQGVDATTMREIAEASEISPATLYRYFANKEQILLDPATRNSGRLASLLDAQPRGASLERAIGEALRAFVEEIEPTVDEIIRVRTLIDSAPAARALVWDMRALELAALQEAIARRSDARADDLWVAAAARTAIMIVELTLDLRRDDPGSASMSERVEKLVALLTHDRRVLPVLAGG